MSMNEIPAAERVHIAFFGRRNAGKSSVVNAITGQNLSIVSDTPGTTTDPVRKTMELLPMGPVVIIDTPGFDDEGALGEERVRKTRETLQRTDVAVLVLDGTKGITECDKELIGLFDEKKIPYIIVHNKSDLTGFEAGLVTDDTRTGEKLPMAVNVSALTGQGIWDLKECIAATGKSTVNRRKLISDLVECGDVVVLVIPIDESAPKGRLILPQQMVIRDLLEVGALPICTRETELDKTLKSLGKAPKMVVTDSQAFGKIESIVPREVHMTSFSILMARYKGTLATQLEGVHALAGLKDGDKVLISEGCTHHRQCGDIGTVKLPNWIKNFTGRDICFETSSGLSFPDDLRIYKLVIHCGACMLNEKEVVSRIEKAKSQGVPVTNYGTAIAYLHGILDRSLEPLNL